MTYPFLRFPILFIMAVFLASLAVSGPGAQAQASPASAQISTPSPSAEPSPTQPRPACETCHAEVQKNWFEGAHSLARTGHVLKEASNCVACHPKMMGGQMVPSGAPAATHQPGDPAGGPNTCPVCHTTGYDPATNSSKSQGFPCEACHSPIPANHPESDMPIYTGTNMCASCHSDSRFNWSEWKDSKHFKEGMRCVECHDPHSTTLKSVGKSETASKASLCIKCHSESLEMSPFSVHDRAGVTCEQCHLGEKQGLDLFHVVPNNSFKPRLETCNKCHADQIHQPAKPGEDIPAAIYPKSSPTPFVQYQEEKRENNSPNLFLLAALMGMIGVLVGLVYSPRLKNILHKEK